MIENIDRRGSSFLAVFSANTAPLTPKDFWQVRQAVFTSTQQTLIASIVSGAPINT